MSTFIGMGANSHKDETKELLNKVAILEKEIETEKAAKEEALNKVAILEKEIEKLNKKNK